MTENKEQELEKQYSWSTIIISILLTLIGLFFIGLGLIAGDILLDSVGAGLAAIGVTVAQNTA